MTDLKTRLTEALAAYNSGRAADAAQVCREILAVEANSFDALHILAAAQSKLGEYEAALPNYDRAVALQPKHLDALSGRGFVQLQLKKYEDAVASYDRAIALKPTVATWFFNRGNALRELKRFDDALESFARAVTLTPSLAEAHNNCGNILKHLDRHEEAIVAYDRALAARPAYPDALWNYGRCLNSQYKFSEALAKFDQALALQPDHVEALWSRGYTLAMIGRHEDEISHYERAFATYPDHAGMRVNHAVTSLLLGDFANGWIGYEWRKKVPEQWPFTFAGPRWTGKEAIKGKTVLLHHEQGLGDTIQFCRYVPQLAARGARVVLQVQKPLQALVRSLAGSPRIVASGDSLPEYDFHCAMLSLPLAFATRLDSIPSATPYLRAPAFAVGRWRSRLGPKFGSSKNLRIGLVWSGNPKYLNDRNRSVPLEDLVPLLKSNMTFVSLQKELRQGDAETIAQHTNLIHFGGDLHDFSDTAALVDQLDLVISVDTSAAHLAGAMGKPLWMMLPYVPDWRWLLQRDDNPWYPTARLFRQDTTRQWGSVVGKIQSALEALSSARTS